jgi:hypothetical protein
LDFDSNYTKRRNHESRRKTKIKTDHAPENPRLETAG